MLNKILTNFGICILTAICSGGSVIADEPLANEKSRRRDLTEFSREGWMSREYGENRKEVTRKLDNEDNIWQMPLQLPGMNEFLLRLKNTDLHGWDYLELELRLPENLPPGVRFYVFSKDWDHLWRQAFADLALHTEHGISRITVPLTGKAARSAWQPREHKRPWHTLIPGQLLEIGCLFMGAPGKVAEFAGSVELISARVRSESSVLNGNAPEIRSLLMQPETAYAGEMIEWSFELGAAFTDPFTADQVKITATVLAPDGRQSTLSGFYFEDFLITNFTAGAAGLLPHGYPRFKLRYTPELAGTHIINIRVDLDNGRRGNLELPPWEFTVAPARSEWRGFVEIDPDDRRFLRFTDGIVFNGVGMNVRSPLDTRYRDLFPYSKWRDESLETYRKLFAKYRDCGINVVEVWMSSWWLALEWIPDAPGNHGVGYMNQYRAWMLDKLLEMAEEYDIYLILVINNHGKFGTMHDGEWERNPYNRKNGGFLDNCEDYYSDERANAACRRYLDYTVARWSHSPRILIWKLFTEIDLTGTSHNFYREPKVAAWHQKMASHLLKIDPRKRPVTTHWMLDYTRANPEVTGLPELELLTFDAYYQGGINGRRRLPDLFKGTVGLGQRLDKPVIITEFGGSSYGDTAEAMLKQARFGLWSGFFLGFSMPPMFWWFALVDEHDQYEDYRAFANFMGAEDRRGMQAEQKTDAASNLEIYLLKSQNRFLAWVYDFEYHFSLTENTRPEIHEQFTVTLPATMTPGTYKVEFWDTDKGCVSVTETIRIQADTPPPPLQLPPFTKDIAVKLYPAPPATPEP